MSTKFPSTVDRSIGQVTGYDLTVMVIEVKVDAQHVDADPTEVHLRVNGRKVLTLHPERARRLGLITTSW